MRPRPTCHYCGKRFRDGRGLAGHAGQCRRKPGGRDGGDDDGWDHCDDGYSIAGSDHGGSESECQGPAGWLPRMPMPRAQLQPPPGRGRPAARPAPGSRSSSSGSSSARSIVYQREEFALAQRAVRGQRRRGRGLPAPAPAAPAAVEAGEHAAEADPDPWVEHEWMSQVQPGARHHRHGVQREWVRATDTQPDLPDPTDRWDYVEEVRARLALQTLESFTMVESSWPDVVAAQHAEVNHPQYAPAHMEDHTRSTRSRTHAPAHQHTLFSTHSVYVAWLPW